MTLDALKATLAGLDRDELREVTSFVMDMVRRANDPDRPKRLAAILDRKDASRWLTLEQADEKLDWQPDVLDKP